MRDARQYDLPDVSSLRKAAVLDGTADQMEVGPGAPGRTLTGLAEGRPFVQSGFRDCTPPGLSSGAAHAAQIAHVVTQTPLPPRKWQPVSTSPAPG